ncbi:MAG: hypothetical protein SP4CHLAM5_03930 [Chlamydiia bacterium]|nr:hypothetical protein [Chlamydiia bacterium]MCH9618266.1 hypothetical protein [Chlamydiia bacterium]MCH9624766.1 hypothetical protein [Chlamydiia bacterium]
MTISVLQNSLASTAEKKPLEKFLSERAILDADEKIKEMRRNWADSLPTWLKSKEYVMGGDSAFLYYVSNKVRFMYIYINIEGVEG